MKRISAAKRSLLVGKENVKWTSPKKGNHFLWETKNVEEISPARRSQLASVPIAPALPPISTTSKQSVTKIFKYLKNFDLNIYLDLHSYHFLDTNTLGYSFVARFGYEYIQMFVRINWPQSPLHQHCHPLVQPQNTFSITTIMVMIMFTMITIIIRIMILMIIIGIFNSRGMVTTLSLYQWGPYSFFWSEHAIY